MKLMIHTLSLLFAAVPVLLACALVSSAHAQDVT